MDEETKKLLSDIRHELVMMNNLIVTDKEDYINKRDFWRLDTAQWIHKIDYLTNKESPSSSSSTELDGGVEELNMLRFDPELEAGVIVNGIIWRLDRVQWIHKIDYLTNKARSG